MRKEYGVLVARALLSPSSCPLPPGLINLYMATQIIGSLMELMERGRRGGGVELVEGRRRAAPRALQASRAFLLLVLTCTRANID